MRFLVKRFSRNSTLDSIAENHVSNSVSFLRQSVYILGVMERKPEG